MGWIADEISEKKVYELEDMTVETIQNETYREKKKQNNKQPKKRASVSCGTISNGLVYI